MIDRQTLIDAAKAATGLSDFGDDWFMPNLDKLIGYINAEAGLLAPTGGPVDRLVQALSERLKLVQLLKDTPEILDEKVDVAGAAARLDGTKMIGRSFFRALFPDAEHASERLGVIFVKSLIAVRGAK